MTSRLISRPASLEISPRVHRLQIGDRGERKGLRPGQFGNVVPSQSGVGGADRRGEARFGAQSIAAGDEGEIVGAAAQLVDEISDQSVEPAGFADQADQRLARHGFWGGEDGGFDAQQSIRASGRLRVSRRGRRKNSSSSRRRRRAAALIGRTAGSSVSPRSSRTSPSATRRSNRRRAARSVIGAWRAASAGEAQSSAKRRSTIFAAGLARNFGATAMRVSERRERSAARSRAEAAASAIAPAAAFGQAGSPGLKRRSPPYGLRPGSRLSRRDQRQGQRPKQPDGEDEVEHPKGEDFGFGCWGVREEGEGEGGGLGGRRNRIALPCAEPSGWPREPVKVIHGQIQAARLRQISGRRRGRAGGRRGRATA